MPVEEEVMRSTILVVCLTAAVGAAIGQAPPARQPVTIPRVWDDRAVASLEVPLADPRSNLKHITADLYYRMPVRRVLKSYPVYHPKFEPVIDGKPYREWLEAQKPQEILTELSALTTESDWSTKGTTLGKDVFEAAIDDDSDPFGAIVRLQDVRDPEWYEHVGVPYADDGLVPFVRYIVTDRGVRVGNLSCAMCHTRVLKREGAPTLVLQGGPGNFPFDKAIAWLIADQLKATPATALADQRAFIRMLFGTPWLTPDPITTAMEYPLESVMATYDAIPPGALARHGTSLLSPAQVPDLIGVQERHYLDHTGL